MKNSRTKRLLIVNYSMNPNNPIFGHSYEIVVKFASHFDQIHVITLDAEDYWNNLPINVFLYRFDWNSYSNIQKAVFIVIKILRLIKRNRIDLVFFHMTDLVAGLTSPWIRFMKVPQVLWYAHISNSFWFRLSSRIMDAVLTSTVGSVPKITSKTFFLGQSISELDFYFNPSMRLPMRTAGIVGRVDPSKRVDFLICQFLLFASARKENLSLEIVGNATASHTNYAAQIQRTFTKELISGQISLNSALPRVELPDFYHRIDFLLHGYLGSLDKVLIEATLVGTPVITSNQEYLNIFGSWGSNLAEKEESIFFQEEIDCLLSLDRDVLLRELIRRKEIANSSHTLESWIIKATHVFSNLIDIGKTTEKSGT